MIWMLIGIVAFGFGILYMNRMGEESSLYQGDGSNIQNAVIPPIQTLPETYVPPIQETQEEIIEPDLEQEEKSQTEFDEELERALQEMDLEDEKKLEKVVSAPVQKQEKRIEKAIPLDTKPVASMPASQALFDVQLDPQVLSIIQQRIAATPHVGYRPVVQVMKNGNVNLTFLKL